MPPRVPQYELPEVAARPVSPPYQSGQPIGAALFTQGAGALARGADTLAEGEYERGVRQQLADTEYRFQVFQDDWRKQLVERQRTAPPGAAGFTDQVATDYRPAASKFMATLSPLMQQQFQARVAGFGSQLTSAALTFQNAEGERYGKLQLQDGIDRAKTRVLDNPDALPAAAADVERLIATDTYLSEAAKDELRRRARSGLTTAGAMGRINGDPAAAAAWAGGGSYNVGNIRSSVGGFRTYATPEDAVAATIQNARAYPKAFNGGQNMTIAQIGAKWAPAGDGANDPVQWAKNVAAASGLPVDKPIDLSDPATAAAFAKGVHVAEFGSGALYPADAYTKGATMALAGNAPPDTGPGTRHFVVPEGMTYEDALKVQAHAREVVRQARADDARASAERKGTWELAIATGQVASPEQIMADKGLRDGDKATLINTWVARNKNQILSDAVVREYQDHLNGTPASYNPFDENDRKKGEVIWGRLAGPGSVLTDERNQAVARQLFQATGLAPKPVVAAIRAGLDSKDPRQVEAAAAMAAWMNTANPAGFQAIPDGADLRKAADRYQGYVDRLGMSADEAARHIAAENDPETKIARDALKQQLEGEKGELAKLSSADMVRAVGGSTLGPITKLATAGILGDWHSLSGGYTDRDTAVALADYRELFRDAYMRHGDPAKAKAEADQQFARLYTVSRVGGRQVLMKYAPERFYPAVDGGYDWIASQAAADIKQATGKDVQPGDIVLRTGSSTEREARAGIPPAYELLYYNDRDGQRFLDRLPMDFRPDPRPAAKAAQAAREAGFRAGQEQASEASAARAAAMRRQPYSRGADDPDRIGVLVEPGQ